MSDLVETLRIKAAQCSLATPYVRVNGDLLIEAANEIARLRKLEEDRLKLMLFETTKERT